MALKPGLQAPSFTLKTKTPQGLQDVSLEQNLGKKQTVLLFFPLAFTSVCTREMCTVSQDIEQYSNLDAAVYGISVDSPFAQEVWARQNNLNFPILSDFNRTVCRAYDVCYEDLLGFHGVAKRSAFVIGRDGVILWSWHSEDPHQLPDFDAIRQALAAGAPVKA